MKISDRRKNMALKMLGRRRRFTEADLAAAASSGERRLRADDMALLGKRLADLFVRAGLARRIAQTHFFEWVEPMT